MQAKYPGSDDVYCAQVGENPAKHFEDADVIAVVELDPNWCMILFIKCSFRVYQPMVDFGTLDFDWWFNLLWAVTQVIFPFMKWIDPSYPHDNTIAFFQS